MSEYYFLGTYIPELRFDAPLEMSLKSYTELLEDHLSPEDKKKWIQLCRGEETEGFAESYLIEERAVRLILVALRAKKWGRSLATELQSEDSSDDLVAYILAQKDAKTFEPPIEYAELKTLYEKFGDEPLELHRALLNYRFQKADELIGLQTFTLDRLLAYYIQLVLADQWKNINTIA